MMAPVLPLALGAVELPEGHPRASSGRCLIQGFAVAHPDGIIVVDTGAADDHEQLNELYHPVVTPIVEALNAVDLDERDVVAIVNTHLHFDHCGQNRSMPWAPVWVQAAEYQLVETPRFTIAEWATIPLDRRRQIDGDTDLADGVRIVATPGHTPGHQSVVVESDEGTTVIGGQCCYTCTEFESIDPLPADLHDETWLEAARNSIRRLHAEAPDVVHLSHDPTPLRIRR